MIIIPIRPLGERFELGTPPDYKDMTLPEKIWMWLVCLCLILIIVIGVLAIFNIIFWKFFLYILVGGTIMNFVMMTICCLYKEK